MHRMVIMNLRAIMDIKYFTEAQVRLLRRTVKDKAVADQSKKNKTGIREWMVIDLITSTGLRVEEVSNLRCGDLKAGYGQCEVFVSRGKGGRSRTVEIPQSLKTHLNQYLKWKKEQQERIGPSNYLFVGQRGPWTAQAIQQLVKKYLKKLGLYERGKSVHALRHSYAVQLYRKKRDLRAVQKQLGHASIQTTQIYADVTKEDIQQQINGLW
ncbi:tyrosine-type recombinase/integrase [Desulfosudis oleivorans]|uniref:Integrase family protein n=1 Tax=Desulfosudis oleivorans (strain DSM 6200 / JCM 39069 / Hxd3) TaxID=96561 RepID=A8ZXD3_DESOH|nr:tyrosine-type recombinase/integrase [Desulfosudis oleivorans]ABW68512.1 integrase family protein [Desulfosudis oleivorans Hxd3]